MIITEEQREEAIAMIADKLEEDVRKDGELHYVNYWQAAMDICAILAALDISYKMGASVWMMTHPDLAKKLMLSAQEKGISSREQLFIEIIESFFALFSKYDSPNTTNNEE